MNLKRTLLFISLFIQVISFACHDTEILSVTSTNNGNNTTTFNIECKIGVGTLDGYSYGFALIFSNSTGTAPLVLTSPAFTPTLTRPGYDPLTGYTGSNIGTGTAVTYFSSRYGNRSDVLSYESDDDWFGFGSSTYIRTITVTLQGCVENIHLDGDFRSSGTAVADATCGDNYLTGFSCCSTVNSSLDTTLCNGGFIVVNGTTYDGSNPTGQEIFTLAGGCDSIVTITVTELSVITNSINPTICSNGSYIYDGVTYDANNTTGTHIFTSAFGCDSTVTVTLTIQNQITHNIETILCYGDSIVVNGVIYNGNNPNGQEIISLPNGCDSVININITEIVPDTAYIDTVIYVGQSLDISGVVLIESDFEGIVYLQASNGCDSIVSVKVLMLYESTHFVPSGFSPNGDGVNDYTGVMGGGIEEMEFSIFNRWGELIFNADCCCSQACLWDGKYRNQIQNVGTYVYYLNGIYTNGMPFKEKGTISLIK